jgi:hypothetical protein
LSFDVFSHQNFTKAPITSDEKLGKISSRIINNTIEFLLSARSFKVSEGLILSTISKKFGIVSIAKWKRCVTHGHSFLVARSNITSDIFACWRVGVPLNSGPSKLAYASSEKYYGSLICHAIAEFREFLSTQIIEGGESRIKALPSVWCW